jgi:hypothetical protein
MKMAERPVADSRGRLCVLPGFDVGLLAQAPSYFVVPLAADEGRATLAGNTKRLRVSFAARGRPEAEARALLFRIWALKTAGEERRLVWDQRLELGPAATIVKSRATVDVQLSGMSELLFETVPASSGPPPQGAWLGVAPASAAADISAAPVEDKR